jgi:hypothetical protein
MNASDVKIEDIHIPTGNVAVFGRTGTGKSSLFHWTKFVRKVICSDTGSLGAHRLYNRDLTVEIDPMAKHSPLEQVISAVNECSKRGELFALDSWTTLQEHECCWTKRNSPKNFLSLPLYGVIVNRFRDLALFLSGKAGFTVFNTSPGGKGKAPDGTEVIYPGGAVTGFPALSGVGLNSETILARWSNVWGVFAGWKEIPRGLYVPGNDIRPENHSLYAPLKDPLMVISDSSGNGVMAVPNLMDKANFGRCFADELLAEIAVKFPKTRRQGAKEAGNEEKSPKAAARAEPEEKAGGELVQKVLAAARAKNLSWPAIRSKHAEEAGFPRDIDAVTALSKTAAERLLTILAA